MQHTIHTLPAHLANQIAAGEVIQRPASAVKELLENAVDAGATAIQLIVTDAGKSLIQVIDNGCGMGEEDACNCFGRHATSKISAVDDLFRLRTMGFRGEALASIAAVSQVVLKTKRAEEELGIELELENSLITKQQPCAIAQGTSIAMKNLFFNVPARRNFLKSNAVEMRHITEEFIHVALAFPDIFFSLTSNGQEVFHLERGGLKQRVLQLMGNTLASQLVAVKEHTDYLDISGFIGKPTTAKKTRGEQYLFVNNRFVRNPYLSHAIISAYEEMIPQGSFPFFALFIELDPAHVDVNVHPTKQEIKFVDEKIVYAFIRSAIRHALAQFSIAPSMDFSLEPAIQQLDSVSKPFTAELRGEAETGGLYKSFVDRHQAHRIGSSSNLRDWKDFFETSNKEQQPVQMAMQQLDTFQGDIEKWADKPRPSSLNLLFTSPVFQLHQTYIVFEQANGMTILHQQLAHQQVLFEKFKSVWAGKGMAIQQSLFPQVINLSAVDAQLMQSLLPDLLHMGYQLEPFGANAFLLQGAPADHPSDNDQQVLEMIMEDIKDGTASLHQQYRERMAKSLARKHAVKTGTKLAEETMRDIVERLSLCMQPTIHFDGSPMFVEVKRDFLTDNFGI
ncbi:MAG: mismatch repair endonuclease MutL [Bacteroidota bacterium]